MGKKYDSSFIINIIHIQELLCTRIMVQIIVKHDQEHFLFMTEYERVMFQTVSNFGLTYKKDRPVFRIMKMTVLSVTYSSLQKKKNCRVYE